MNQSIIEHKANYYYVEFREDYLEIAKKWAYKKPVKDGQKSKASDHCKALILSIMEHWTNTKRGQGEDLSIYMSYPQWVEAMYHMFSRSVIIDSLEELMGEEGKEGLIERSEYMMYGRKTFKYLLNYRLLNSLMKELPDRDPHQTLPKGNGADNGDAPHEDDPSKNRRDASKNTPVASTNGRHASKSKPVASKNTPVSDIKGDATRLKVNDDPSKSKRNIYSYRDSTETLNTDSTERERPDTTAQPSSSQSTTSSLSLSSEISSTKESTLPDSTCHEGGVIPPPSSVGGSQGGAIPTRVEEDTQPPPGAGEKGSASMSRISPLVAPSTRIRSAHSQNDLLSQLTEEQSAFWTRWCGISQTPHSSLNETAYSHVVELADKITTTTNLQSLYDDAYDRIIALSTAKGTTPVPPRLGNLVATYPEWSKKKTTSAKVAEADEASRGFLPGTGKIINYTELRLQGKAAPIVYDPLPVQATKKTTWKPVARPIEFEAMLEDFNRRRVPGQPNQGGPVE